MSEKATASSSGGIGFVGLLTIVFITLKLTDFIAWSWWWVLSPLWISAGIVVSVLAIALLVILVLSARYTNRLAKWKFR